jgi:hypothetical protein
MMPVPSNGTTVWVPVVESLVKLKDPDAGPAVRGSNCTWIVTAMPGFKVTGNVAPEKVNPDPVMLTEDTVTAELPVEVRVRGRDTGVLSETFPKLKRVAFKVRTGPLILVPVRATMSVLPPESLLDMVAVPAADPTTAGLKLSCSVTDCPGFSVVGNVAPEKANPPPATITE